MTALEHSPTTLLEALRGHSRERVVVVPNSVWDTHSPIVIAEGCEDRARYNRFEAIREVPRQ
jgi:hypothetical protein